MPVAKPFRAEDWWIGKASLLVGLVYLFSIYFQIPFEHFGLWAMCSLVTIIGFASLGYLLNDYFDQAQDKLAGKKNFLLNTSAVRKTAYFCLALLMLFAPWYYLPFDTFTVILIVLQLLLFLFYSAPGLRLKERGILGLITDALYAHSIPAIMAAHTYALISNKPTHAVLILLLFTWQFFVGIRNILLHQQNDKDSDIVSGTKTFIRSFHFSIPVLSLLAIQIIEMLLFLSLFGVLSKQNHVFLIPIVAVIISLPSYFIMNVKNGYRLYFPNVLYDHTIPITLIMMLTFTDFRYLILLPIQLILFSKEFIIELIFYLPIIECLNFLKVTLLKTYFYFISTFKLIINWLIYILFKFVGVDLVKEKTDAKGYILRQLNKKK
jgi:hypothetical protein